MMRKHSKNLLFSIGTTFLFICIVEVVLCIIGYNPKPFKDNFRLKVCGELLGEYDEGLFWRLKDVKPAFEAWFAENSLKIICLTDSVSVMYQGRGYPEILQDLLADIIYDRKPVVFNGGVPGYTSFQGLKYFTTELLSYNPDVISICYGWNDHWQSGNGLPDKLQRLPKVKVVMTIINQSRFFGFLISLAMKIRQSRYKSVGPEQSTRVSILDYERNLRVFVDICKQKEIIVILMTAPYLDGSEDWIPTHIKYNSIVRKIANEKEIPIVDLVKVFRERRDLFIDPVTDKTHYNWEGSQVIAQALAEIIVKESGLS